jgi:riboflavin kinase / FMN adenylyltransferase
MRVVRDIREMREPPEASAVTIGNFDGVHLAHQQLLSKVVTAARQRQLTATAITFEPHPIKVLAPDHAPKLLTPLERKMALIEKQGIQLLVVLPFHRELARLGPLEFVREILVKPLRAKLVMVGPNFRFGYRQSGDAEVLGELARQEGFDLEIVPMLLLRGQRVSSTRIRELLVAGRMGLAGRLLGRPYSLSGPIVAGMGVGRRHTVPTLNLSPVEEQLPKIGVYVTRTRLASGLFDSVTNVGVKPTFGGTKLSVETFLLGYSGGEIQDIAMEIEFLWRLRDEIKFQNPAMLKAQIQEDARRSLKFFRLLAMLHDRVTARSRQKPTLAG